MYDTFESLNSKITKHVYLAGYRRSHSGIHPICRFFASGASEDPIYSFIVHVSRGRDLPSSPRRDFRV